MGLNMSAIGISQLLRDIDIDHQNGLLVAYTARTNKSSCFVLQYNTKALVLVLQY